MLLSDRRGFLLLAGGGLLTGCGFTPVYRSGTAASDLHGKIEIGLVTGRNGFELRERLEERLGFASDTPLYNLTFTLKTTAKGLAVTADEGTTRFNLEGVAKFVIKNAATDAVVFTDSVKNVTAYSATSETYPSRVAELDANVRLSQSLAEQIANRIAITAKGWHT